MEYIDLYTREKQNTGMTAIRGAGLPTGYYQLIVFVCIFNSEGRMLIQQRSLDKKECPGIWDVSVGGGVQSGETSAMAAARETKEELGLEIDFTQEAPYLTLYYEQCIHDIYIIRKDVAESEMSLQPEEVRQVIWADEEMIGRMIDSGEFLNVSPAFIRMLFEMQYRRGILAGDM